MKLNKLILFFSLCSSLAAPVAAKEVCSTPEGFIDHGIGGTGLSGDEKGIGGTGISFESGIGGTGISSEGGIGGTGINAVYVSGTIYAHGSICVNGLRITYDDKTPVQDGDKSVKATNLQLGQFVHVFAERAHGERTLTARHITVSHVLEGPVTRVERARKLIHVMGEPLNLAPHVVIPRTVQVGVNVRVSGLRNNNEGVVASHIAVDSSPSAQTVAGEVSRDAKGNIRVGRTQVDITGGSIPEIGSSVVASGDWAGKALKVDRIVPDMDIQPKEPAFVSLEGYIEHVRKDGHVEMCNKEVIVDSEYEGKLRRGERVILSGVVGSDGDIEVRHVFERTSLATHFSERSESEHAGRESAEDGKNNTSTSDGKNETRESDKSESGKNAENVSHSGSGNSNRDDVSSHSDNSGSGNSGDRPESATRIDNSGSGSGDSRPESNMRIDNSGPGSGDSRPELPSRPDNSGSGSGDNRPELPSRPENSGPGSGDSRPELPSRPDNSGSGSGERPETSGGHGGGPGSSR